MTGKFEHKCLICDHTWEADSPEKCPKCGEYDDVFCGVVNEHNPESYRKEHDV